MNPISPFVQLASHERSAALEQHPERDVEMAPISPDKAPRYLRLMPKKPCQSVRKRKAPPDPLNKSVTRALFIKSAKHQYRILIKRDVKLAKEQPEKSEEYYRRACEYQDQVDECKKTSGIFRHRIARALSYDRVEQNLNTQLPWNSKT
jgi:hypothetical protein